MYCIYTDQDIAEESGNLDHIIPLSLGGTNGFVVWSDKDYNSVVGSEVDGAINKDLLIAPHLMQSGVRGHSKKPAAPRWRKATIEGRPAQVTLTSEGFDVWDALERRNLSQSEIANRDLILTFNIGAFTALRFLAKVALGGGYYVYGDQIKSVVDCASLRKTIMLDLEAARQDAKLLASDFQVCDRFHKDSKPGGEAYLYRVACEKLGRSVFIAQPHHGGVSFHVGITGSYIGSMFCPGDTKDLPLAGDHDLGHVVVLAPGVMERLSLREFMKRLWRDMTETEPPEPDEAAS